MDRDIHFTDLKSLSMYGGLSPTSMASEKDILSLFPGATKQLSRWFERDCPGQSIFILTEFVSLDIETLLVTQHSRQLALWLIAASAHSIDSITLFELTDCQQITPTMPIPSLSSTHLAFQFQRKEKERKLKPCTLRTQALLTRWGSLCTYCSHS